MCEDASQEHAHTLEIHTTHSFPQAVWAATGSRSSMHFTLRPTYTYTGCYNDTIHRRCNLSIVLQSLGVVDTAISHLRLQASVASVVVLVTSSSLLGMLAHYRIAGLFYGRKF